MSNSAALQVTQYAAPNWQSAQETGAGHTAVFSIKTKRNSLLFGLGTYRHHFMTVIETTLII